MVATDASWIFEVKLRWPSTRLAGRQEAGLGERAWETQNPAIAGIRNIEVSRRIESQACRREQSAAFGWFPSFAG